MTEAILVKQEVEPEKVSKLNGWLKEVSNRTDEVVETLQDEDVATESVFLEESSHGTFLVTYMEAEDVQEAQEAFAESTHEIDVEHKQVLQECLICNQAVESLQPVYHIVNPDR
ncbi:DUF6176 family protein [Halobacterium salinarum]|uniref:DUF6176 family protein n=1 Tax=Halobacterium TaxID=2239 RepID=UPI0025575CA7|nr:DUF6176 family protein [Halobacterium salinarum]MDL0131440.1 DUF6176 family protein [Halobacterium salinarum]MDL0145884.1 DUF6176 family protein [Halobacterium salinarum]